MGLPKNNVAGYKVRFHSKPKKQYCMRYIMEGLHCERHLPTPTLPSLTIVVQSGWHEWPSGDCAGLSPL